MKKVPIMFFIIEQQREYVEDHSNNNVGFPRPSLISYTETNNLQIESCDDC